MNLWGIVSYWRSHPFFWWGLFIDGLILPFAALMRITKWLFPMLSINRLFPLQGNLPLVFLVHGSGANDLQWLPVAYLYLKGKYDIRAIRLSSAADQDIASHAYALVGNIKRVYDRDRRNVTLIGASMGGLVAMSAAADIPELVDRVITIGSPFEGAPLIEMLSLTSKTYDDMRHKSEFLRDLVAEINQTAIDLICFGGKGDFMVPDECSYPHYTNAQHITHPHGHWSGVILPYVWRRIDQLVPRPQ